MRSFIVDVVLLLQFCYIAVIFRYRYIAVYKKTKKLNFKQVCVSPEKDNNMRRFRLLQSLFGNQTNSSV